MSMWHCTVERINKVEIHPSGDFLEILDVGGYQIVNRKGQFKEGDLCSFIQIDSNVTQHSAFDFLDKKDRKRIRAKRLRGVFSQGLAISEIPSGAIEGDSVVEYFKITRWIAPEERQDYTPDGLSLSGKSGNNDKIPEGLNIPYYDIEPLRKYKKHLEGKNVVITEKIHGENCAKVFWNGELKVKSRNFFKKNQEDSRWHEVANRENYEEKFSKYPGLAFWGELYGNVSGFRYDCKIEGTIVHRKFRVFDIFDVANQKFLEYDNVKEICKELGLEMVPELYRGPWLGEVHYDLANGNSTIGNHIKEGFVVKVIPESRHENEFSQLKFIGEEYLLRK